LGEERLGVTVCGLIPAHVTEEAPHCAEAEAEVTIEAPRLKTEFIELQIMSMTRVVRCRARRERECEREARPAARSRQSEGQRRQGSRSLRRDRTRDEDRRSRESSSDTGDSREEIERIRGEISRFLGRDFDRWGGFTVGGHGVEIYRPKGRGMGICGLCEDRVWMLG
jgi:hypothetical protein